MSEAAAAPSFWNAAEQALADRFLREGYLIEPVEDRDALDRIRQLLADRAAAALNLKQPDDHGHFLDRIGEVVDVARLNEFRLRVIGDLNAAAWARPAYFSIARRKIETIAGNELAMQRRLNLSIQLPGDDSSLLPVHADVWSGDSPFEIVLWTPLVNCYGTKAMYILPPEPAKRLERELHAFKGKSSEDIYRAFEKDVIFLEVPYGHCLLFNQNLPHGNRVNDETETRWSINCRFKGVFTPYADKKIGEFFEPITLRPASRIGLAYELPGGFDG
ncbi:sporadic carbohydrate cluster 2OG-Fe(II) oxygenase [Roseiterribacter gracilis]|uniref:2OG-Fe(II) oxygenase n=1 Tax=Roseiterribacter gracilis TaxID=2812848 RepID=A0A8S8XHR0_9PROT|nr:hypothetical protein TMPK1_36960 [Rhodospirillales bacterium TMPK1]